MSTPADSVPSSPKASSSSSKKVKKQASLASSASVSSPSLAPQSSPSKPAESSSKKRKPVEQKQDKSEDSGAPSEKKPKKPRRAPFQPLLPKSYLDLSEVWRYVAALKKGLYNTKRRLQQTKDEAERARLAMNINRYETNLIQVDENKKDTVEHVKLLMEMAKMGFISLKSAETLTKFAKELDAHLGITSLDQSNEDEKESDE